MLDLTAIENALVAWVKTVTGTSQVILADQNAPAPPEGLYLAVKLGAVDRIGRDQAGPTNGSGIRTLLGNREFPCTLHAYRQGGRAALDALANSLDTEGTRDTLREAGIAVWDIGPVTQVPQTLESTLREHGVLEIFLRVGVSRTEDVGFIAQVELTGTTEHPPAPDTVETVTIGDSP